MLDTEKLILEVEKCPAIYDTHSKEYGNRGVKSECWDQIGAALYDDWDQMTPDKRDITGKHLMKKWKSVRDNFVRELRTMKNNETGTDTTKKRRYMYFDHLSFLLPYVKASDKTSYDYSTEDVYSHEEDLEENPVIELQDIGEDFFSEPAAKRRRRAGLSDTVLTTASTPGQPLQDMLRQDQDADRSGNRAFLMSFLPTMESLPPLDGLEVRMKITEVFRNAAAKLAGKDTNP